MIPNIASYAVSKAANAVTLASPDGVNVVATFQQFDQNTGANVGSYDMSVNPIDIANQLATLQAQMDALTGLQTDAQAALAAYSAPIAVSSEPPSPAQPVRAVV